LLRSFRQWNLAHEQEQASLEGLGNPA